MLVFDKIEELTKNLGTDKVTKKEVAEIVDFELADLHSFLRQRLLQILNQCITINGYSLQEIINNMLQDLKQKDKLLETIMDLQ